MCVESCALREEQQDASLRAHELLRQRHVLRDDVAHGRVATDGVVRARAA